MRPSLCRRPGARRDDYLIFRCGRALLANLANIAEAGPLEIAEAEPGIQPRSGELGNVWGSRHSTLECFLIVETFAKAEPDIQALIAERIEAGEIFTAAKVKEIRKEAAREAAEQEADAAEIRMRATRRLDQMRQAQKETVGLAKGGDHGGKRGIDGVRKTPANAAPTLAEAGIDKNLAKEGRKLGALSDTEFETAVAETRKAVTSAARSGGS
ncbi:hypothetical protein ACCT05_14985 [Rhizobium ruizarguesonis]